MLHKLVSQQAERSPRAIAVIDGDRRLSYAELDSRANRLARFLRDLGTSSETPIGVRMHRSANLAVALLAVWKAGAAYVPFDPDHPLERLRWMLDDTRTRIVLTEQALAGALRGTAARPVCLDSECAAISACPDTEASLAGQVSGDNLAYVIYTSGSTGRPKGVQITHAGIANRVAWAVRECGFSAADRVLQKTNLSFDAACWEFFAPLISGGVVVMAPPGAERDPAALVRTVAEQDITVLQLVPSVLRLLADETGWDQVRSLRLLFCAGEPLHAELCQRLLERVDVQMWNTYGPTECAIDVTAAPVDPTQVSGPVPIGRPIDHTRVLVLGPGFNPLPPGVPGELYAAGIGVARGYAGAPKLTAERFVPDPYGPLGSRLYRTGDRVRWRPDGLLEYLGRLDDQVKVNGVRIEPAEVESALADHPHIDGSLVAALESTGGGKRLVAYVVPRRGSAEPDTAPAKLRAFLRDRLPDTHVPSEFIVLPEFPLTASGKIDRAALPASGSGGQERPGYVAPRTANERKIAQVWTELLSVDRVGALDDFFQLGGHSLILIELAVKLRAAGCGAVGIAELFSAPTVEAQAHLISADRAETSQLRGTRRGGALPLSFGQRRLWFLDQLRPASPEWVSPLFIRLPADIEPGTVRLALSELTSRHEALRTRYVRDHGEPRQVIDDRSPAELRVVSASRQQLAGIVRAESEQGFDLERGPVWRALLIRQPGGTPLLLLLIHHIACDGWSAKVIEREILELCRAEASGRPAELADPAVQYADYAVWQRQVLTTDVLQAQLRHWREVLEDLPVTELPTDYPRPAERDGRGSVVTFAVTERLADAIDEIGRQCGATPFMTLLTAFSTLLARYTEQWDVLVGTPVSGRNRPELENTVGFFLNSLVLRCRLDGKLSFADAVARVRDASLAAFANQDVPFDHLVDEFQADRDASRTPLYQVAFDLQDGSRTAGVDLTDADLYEQAWGIAKTDLTLFMRRQPDGTLAGVLEYATALFDRATVQRMAGHFTRLLALASADPRLSLQTIDLLSADERGQALADGNNIAEPPAGSVLDMFESQAAATPDAIAVETADGAVVTYAELDARASHYARRLRGLGVGCEGGEAVVGIMLDRSPDLIACLLGTWKTGAAYLPLDPSFPVERLAYMLADAAAAVVITATAHAGRLAGVFAGDLLLADHDRAAAAACPAGDTGRMPPRYPQPGDVAYVIYTSGSTGRPKGVLVTHGGLANHVAWAGRELAARGGTGAALFSSTAFDLVVPNLYAPLVTGQPVRLLAADLDMAEFGRSLVAAGSFSFIKLTPGHLEVLSRQLDTEQAAALAGAVVVAGEAFPAALANHWLDILGPGRLINEYGPTEASVGTCIYPVDAPQASGVVPIGRPLPGMAMYVLDHWLLHTPTGVPGELYAGGAGVARGYANQPGLTAEKFVPDPYGPPGSRLYRTGDRVRRMPDGNVEFLGRLDDQVKIRGYRMELGEIGSVLADHPAIRDAMVVAHPTRQGDKQLVAYCVPQPVPGKLATAAQLMPADDSLAAHCRTRLPDYMVPARFIAIEAMPLSKNGKVDRGKLPDPDEAASAEQAPVTPRNIVEERICSIWAELLGTDLGTTHNFFHAGGNSILAISLIARLQDEFDIDLPVRVIFEAPTVTAQAEAVEDQIKAELAGQSEPAGVTAGMTLKEYEA